MKPLLKFIYLFAMLFCLASCEKPEQDIDTPGPVEDIKISAEVQTKLHTNDHNIKLDASNTNNINGKRILSYSWTCNLFPVGLEPKINGPSNASTTIDSLMAGKYNFHLTVKDDFGHLVNSEFPMEVLQDTLTGAPKIVHIEDKTVVFPATFILVGAASSFYANPAKRKLAFEWSILQKPAANRDPVISDKSNVSTYIRDLEQGDYQVMLRITNEIGLSAYDTFRINVPPAPILETREYEGTWVYVNDPWDGEYLYLEISDPVNFAGRTNYNTTIAVFDLENQIRLDDFNWSISDINLFIHYHDFTLDGKKAKVVVSYYD